MGLFVLLTLFFSLALFTTLTFGSLALFTTLTLTFRGLALFGSGSRSRCVGGCLSHSQCSTNSNCNNSLHNVVLYNLQGYLFSTHSKAKLFAFDTETTSLDYNQARIVGLSFAVEVGEAAYLPLMHDYPDVAQQLNPEDVLNALKPLLEDPNKPKLGQNLKYDAHVLANHGITLNGIAHDSLYPSSQHRSLHLHHR